MNKTDHQEATKITGIHTKIGKQYYMYTVSLFLTCKTYLFFSTRNGLAIIAILAQRMSYDHLLSSNQSRIMKLFTSIIAETFLFVMLFGQNLSSPFTKNNQKNACNNPGSHVWSLYRTTKSPGILPIEIKQVRYTKDMSKPRQLDNVY